jgi:hypothetical protein
VRGLGSEIFKRNYLRYASAAGVQTSWGRVAQRQARPGLKSWRQPNRFWGGGKNWFLRGGLGGNLQN